MTANKLEGKARELVEKWRESAAKLDRGFGPGDSILAAGKRQCADELAALLNTLDTARQSEGMVLVPREPTEAMLAELLKPYDRLGIDFMREKYAAMLAAAPADAGEG